MKYVTRFLGVGVFLLATQLQAQWSSTLEEGGTVTVDPRTNQATLLRDGVSTPLWDGVHKLSDGSTLTVHAGQAMPDDVIPKARQQSGDRATDPARKWVGNPIVGLSPCEQLKRRVCGVNGLCKQTASCDMAQQLLSDESKERSASSSSDVMTFSSGHCQLALQDDLAYKACVR